MSSLQPFLGLDKSNPLIEILLDPSYPDDALVHFGTQLLETVHLGKDSVGAKLLAGRLYNAGFKRKTLTEKFGWDRKTIQGYADALKTGCAEALARALRGKGAETKVDDEKEQFIRKTFRQVYPSEGCHSNTFIRRELEEKMSFKVSRETIRVIINDELKTMAQEGALALEEAEENDPDPAKEEEGSCDNGPSLASNLTENCNLSPSSPTSSPATDVQQTMLLHHGGLFLTRALIDKVTEGVGPQRDLIRQWISSVLCGCDNIEQMGRLNYPSLETIIGPQLNALSTQREALLQAASPELIASLRRCNLQFLGTGAPYVFYYDPHGIEYTGQLEILKGWLGGSHRVGKAYYQDFVHTLTGKPMAAFLDDNRTTLLKRLPANIKELRNLLGVPQETPIVLIVDRAVYSLLELIRYRDELNIYIITWEKNCTRPPWAPPAESEVETTYIPKPRNRSKDIVLYKAQHYCRPWKRDPSVNQYITRLYKGADAEPITLSILSTCPDDLPLSVSSQIEAILTRWVQENNIGYLIDHNGINEMTSYQSYSYEQAAAKLDLDDYLVANPALRQLSAQKLKLRRKRVSLQLKIEDRKTHYQRDEQTKTAELAEIDQALEGDLQGSRPQELKKRRSSLRRSLKTLPQRRQKFLDKTHKEIDRIKQQIHEIDAQCQLEPQKVQRIEYLISQEYDRLNFAPKALMDAIRLLAHNIHRHLHDQFRPLYDNYRNDHRILRELIQSPAFLEETPDDYLVTLIPSRLHGKTASIVTQLISQLPPITTAKGKPLHILLSEPLQGIQLAV